MKPLLKKILMVVGVLFLLAQFIPVDRSAPAVVPNDDFLSIVDAPPAMASLVKSACYDCHSNETKYPWYAKIAPVSLWLQGHVDHGREKLNFSEWAGYEPGKAAHKLEECAEFIEQTKMPLLSYIIAHPEARMDDVQRAGLAQWFKQQYKLQEGLPH